MVGMEGAGMGWGLLLVSPERSNDGTSERGEHRPSVRHRPDLEHVCAPILQPPAPSRGDAEFVLMNAGFVHQHRFLRSFHVPGTVLGRQDPERSHPSKEWGRGEAEGPSRHECQDWAGAGGGTA